MKKIIIGAIGVYGNSYSWWIGIHQYAWKPDIYGQEAKTS